MPKNDLLSKTILMMYVSLMAVLGPGAKQFCPFSLEIDIYWYLFCELWSGISKQNTFEIFFKVSSNLFQIICIPISLLSGINFTRSSFFSFMWLVGHCVHILLYKTYKSFDSQEKKLKISSQNNIISKFLISNPFSFFLVLGKFSSHTKFIVNNVS